MRRLALTAIALAALLSPSTLTPATRTSHPHTFPSSHKCFQWLQQSAAMPNQQTGDELLRSSKPFAGKAKGGGLACVSGL